MIGPDPNAVYPNEKVKQIVYIKNVVTRPNIVVGDYTYYDDVDGAENFERHVTHHYEFLGDKLIIGRFCAIARGIEFVMNGANHRMQSVTTYPFNIMGGGWEKFAPAIADLPLKGDTVVGNDVWIGQNVTVMPGVHIGDGAGERGEREPCRDTQCGGVVLQQRDDALRRAEESRAVGVVDAGGAARGDRAEEGLPAVAGELRRGGGESFGMDSGARVSPRRVRVRRGARGASRIVSDDPTCSAFMSASTLPETMSPSSPRGTGTLKYRSGTSSVRSTGLCCLRMSVQT